MPRNWPKAIRDISAIVLIILIIYKLVEPDINSSSGVGLEVKRLLRLIGVVSVVLYILGQVFSKKAKG